MSYIYYLLFNRSCNYAGPPQVISFHSLSLLYAPYKQGLFFIFLFAELKTRCLGISGVDVMHIMRIVSITPHKNRMSSVFKVKMFNIYRWGQR